MLVHSSAENARYAFFCRLMRGVGECCVIDSAGDGPDLPGQIRHAYPQNPYGILLKCYPEIPHGGIAEWSLAVSNPAKRDESGDSMVRIANLRKPPPHTLATPSFPRQRK